MGSSKGLKLSLSAHLYAKSNDNLCMDADVTITINLPG